MRGALIVLEGCDKSGKSTQCKKLVEYLNNSGRKAELWRFPERATDIGQIINSYIERKTELHDRAVHLLFSANRWELVPKMLEKINCGVTLVVDRYAFSGVAFTSAKGVDFDWCKSSDKGLPLPDQVFYLDIPIDEASTRGDFGGERYEVSYFQKAVQEKFDLLKDKSWQTIDALKGIDEIHKELTTKVVHVLETKTDSTIEMTLFH